MKKNIEALNMLAEYKKRLDNALEKYLSIKISEAEKIDSLAAETIRIVKRFTLSAGKRIRPTLAYYGYLMAGGKDEEAMLEASMAIELMHVFLLIHDDIIDRDDMRHGIKTVHMTYRDLGKKINLSENEIVHFGNSMAIVAGDATYLLANEILYQAKFDSKIIIAALNKMQEIAYRTTQGQMMDILVGAKGFATENEIINIHENKTARYTFEGPLHLGAILANKKEDNRFITSLSAYSIPVGRAFQMQDDILGIFGEEKKLGKAVGADIIEGKQTLLIARAIELGNCEQQRIIRRLLGKKDLDLPELEIFRKIIRETGSLDYSQVMAEKLVNQALSMLENIEFKNERAKNFLEGIAQYIIKREV